MMIVDGRRASAFRGITAPWISEGDAIAIGKSIQGGTSGSHNSTAMTPAPRGRDEASSPIGEWQGVAAPEEALWSFGAAWARYRIDALWLGLFVAANALVFWLRFREYDVDPCVAFGPAIAKGSAEVVVFNCVLALLSVCHRVIDSVRSAARVSTVAQRPVETHRSFHVLVGSVVVMMALVHSASWGLIVHWCRTCDKSDWGRSALAKTPATQRLRERAMLDALPMWTGLVMALGATLLLPFCVGRVRRKWFPAFESVHRAVLVPFVLLLLIHGAAQWTSRLQAPLWLVPALTLYAVERRSRLSQVTSSTILCFDTTQSAGAASSVVIRLFLIKTERFEQCFKSGMFVYLQVPAISSIEWHPFSVCSSPEDALVELRIRVVGDWTKHLLSLLEQARSVEGLDHTLAPVAIPVRLDGPFGTPTLHVDRYDAVLLVALGVGVAPFLSVLRHQLHAWRSALRQPVASPFDAATVHLTLVWVVRDLALVEWLAETLREFDDVVDRMGRDALDLQVFVTTDRHVDAPLPSAHVRVQQCKAGARRPHWPRVVNEWTAAAPPAMRRAVFVSGSHAATSDIKHAVVRARARVDVYAERFH